MVEVTFVASMDTEWGDRLEVKAEPGGNYIQVVIGGYAIHLTVEELQAVLSIGTAMQNGTLFPLPDPSADSHEAFS